ncbi:MAG: aldehyde dehydrogenase [Bacteroidota bacterium]
MLKIKNFINGQLVEPISGDYIDNYDPSKGAVYSLIPDSDERDVNLAVDAALEAFKTWSVMPAEERSRILINISRGIENKNRELAIAESVDNGKPLWLAEKMDIPRAAANFNFYATGILHFASETHSMEDSALNYTLRNPIGVVGCISPWNLPLYLFTWKIAPALAAGNTVVAKPSEITPMTVYLLSEICIEAGLPPGVLNIVHGYGHKVGSAMTVHADVPVISFTGGTKTGETIAKIAAPMFKKLSLELGGKNPNIVFADCDLELAVKTSVRAAFTNQGEICLCGSRIFVERSIYDPFKEEFINESKKMIVGPPDDPKTKVGAIVSKQHYDKILHYIHLAQEEGGTILAGGKAVHLDGLCKDGWFITPTIIENLPYDCRTNQEEIFGPVVTMMPFDTEDEVLKYANSTKYGLAALLFTNNLNKAHRIASKIESGIVWVNCWLLRDLRTPFGGMKQSGVGREGGFEALKFFTEEKNICIKF